MDVSTQYANICADAAKSGVAYTQKAVANGVLEPLVVLYRFEELHLVHKSLWENAAGKAALIGEGWHPAYTNKGSTFGPEHITIAMNIPYDQYSAYLQRLCGNVPMYAAELKNRQIMPIYGGTQGTGAFRPMCLEEVRALVYGNTIWARGNDGSARRCKVNGKPKTWKRDTKRIEVPFKYGIYEYGTFDIADVQSGKLLIRLS